jgi:sec-independent protein translocase protein TatA
MGDALAPWHIIILVIVLVLLFGARRLPGAAKSLGESMNIFKRSVQGLHDDDQGTAANPLGQGSLGQSAMPQNSMAQPFTATQQSPAPIAAPDQTAQQLAELQRQVAELQRQNAGSNGGPVSEAQPTQPF